MAKKQIEQTEIQAPYELPEGWKWCRLGDVADFLGGGTPDKSNSNYWNGNIPWASVKDIKGEYLLATEDFITELGLRESSANLSEKDGLILITRISPGKAIITKIQTAINQDLKIVNTKENKFFLKYFFDNNQSKIEQLSSGTTVKGIKLEILENIPFPLPPTLEEQQRIVNRIETLFAKLDQAKEKAQNVVDTFETRKASILHKAFTGELTRKWREENGVGDDSWETVRFDEIADIKSNLVDVKDYQDFPHIAPDNIEKYTGTLLEYRTIAEDKVTSGKHRFYAGQILYSKIRPYLSKVVVVDFDGLCSADMYPIEAKGNTRFLWYQMLSNEFLDQASNSGSRSVLPKINQKELSIIKMKNCTIEEQIEIVRILDVVFEKEIQAKEATLAVLEQIDLLKKSILARAFRGEI